MSDGLRAWGMSLDFLSLPGSLVLLTFLQLTTYEYSNDSNLCTQAAKLPAGNLKILEKLEMLRAIERLI